MSLRELDRQIIELNRDQDKIIKEIKNHVHKNEHEIAKIKSKSAVMIKTYILKFTNIQQQLMKFGLDLKVMVKENLNCRTPRMI